MKSNGKSKKQNNFVVTIVCIKITFTCFAQLQNGFTTKLKLKKGRLRVQAGKLRATHSSLKFELQMPQMC